MAGLLSGTTGGAGLLPNKAIDLGSDPAGVFKPLALGVGSVSGSTPNLTADQIAGKQGMSIVDLGLAIARAIPRAAITTGFTLGQGLADVTGVGKNKPYVSFDPKTHGLLAQSLLGDEPITPLQKHAGDFSLDHPSVPGPLIALGVAAGDVLDLLPFGGEAGALKRIVLAKDVVEGANIARKLGIHPSLIEQFAQDAVAITKKADAKALIESYAKLQATTKTATKVLQGGKTVESLTDRTPQLPKTTSLPQPRLPSITSYGSDLAKIANTELNVGRLAISPEAKAIVTRVVEEVKPTIATVIGKTLSNAETLKLADESSKILNRVVGRDQTLEWQAAMLKARQALSAASESGTVDEAYIKNLLTIKSQGTDIARKLQSLSIEAAAISPTAKQAIIEAVFKAGAKADEVLRAAKGVDFNNLQQATEFYRKFVKPTTQEWLDLLRYNSMLSSPKTHIINIFSNLLNTTLIAPIEKALTGGLDFLGSKITGNARQAFAGEGASYIKHYFANLKTATFRFAEVMRGTRAYTNLDTRAIPIATKGVKGKVVSTLAFPMKLLEASDQFFTALAEGGQTGALGYRASKGVSVGNIESQAARDAAYRLFRQKPMAEQEGHLLNAVDQFTVVMQGLRNNKNPIVSMVAKFTVPFLQTPMNILKQGIEYSPAGFATLPGAANKTEQLSKAIIGSSIFAGAAMLVASDRVTFGEPIDPALKAAFRAGGKQAYSVKIGNTWVSYQKLPPAVAFPLAMLAAIHDAQQQKKIDDNTVDLVLSSVAKVGQFLSDQSYAKSIGDLLAAAKGGESGIERVISNYAQQLVPYRALGGWLARLTDATQRKVDSQASFVEQQVQLLMMNIPGLTEKVPARIDAQGNPIPAPHPIRNAFSPVQTSDETAAGPEYQKLLDIQKANKITSANSQAQAQQADTEFKIITNLGSVEAKRDYLRQIAQEDPELAKALIAKLKDAKSNTGTAEQRLLNSPTETRARYIVDELNKLKTPEEKKALLADYARKKIVTAATLVEIAKLLKK